MQAIVRYTTHYLFRLLYLSSQAADGKIINLVQNENTVEEIPCHILLRFDHSQCHTSVRFILSTQAFILSSRALLGHCTCCGKWVSPHITQDTWDRFHHIDLCLAIGLENIFNLRGSLLRANSGRIWHGSRHRGDVGIYVEGLPNNTHDRVPLGREHHKLWNSWLDAFQRSNHFGQSDGLFVASRARSHYFLDPQ